MKKTVLLTVFIIFILIAGLSIAYASHPGQGRNGTVPQGPHERACQKGRTGVEKAISNGEAVHCDDIHL